MRAPRLTATVATTAALALGGPVLGVSGLAHATPPSGVQGQVLGAASVPFSAPGMPSGGTDLTLRRIEVAPGGTTGWHYHAGPVYAYVAEGTLTRVLHDCSTVASPAGSVVEEVYGAGEFHVGRNLGATPVVLFVVYAMPAGAPLSHDAPDPGC